MREHFLCLNVCVDADTQNERKDGIMKNFKTLALTGCAVIGLSVQAFAQEPYGDNGFTSHHLVEEKPYENYAEQLSAEEKLELRRYLNYVQRELCQNYREPPQGFIKDGCSLKRDMPERVAVIETKREQMQISNILTNYSINFAFDSAAIEPAAGQTLDQIAREIKKFNPREVTVAGHADKAGPSDYNVRLSERRAQAVSDALNDRGVANRILDEEAYGESRPAVQTNDGVALRENRRVVVEFRK